MDDNTRKLFHQLIVQAEIVIENDYKQLSEFDNVVLAAKESEDSTTGFNFLILQKSEDGEVIYRNTTEEFQNASTLYVLRSNLCYMPECQNEYEYER